MAKYCFFFAGIAAVLWLLLSLLLWWWLLLLLRGCVSVLEMVFVGQCEAVVCLDFVEIFFPLAAKLIGS